MIWVWHPHFSCPRSIVTACLVSHHIGIHILFLGAQSLHGQSSTFLTIAFISICSFGGSKAFPFFELHLCLQGSVLHYPSSVVEMEVITIHDNYHALLNRGDAN